MKKVLDVLIAWHVEPNVDAAVGNTTSAGKLRDKLEVLGLESDLYPIGIHADNRKMFFEICIHTTSTQTDSN